MPNKNSNGGSIKKIFELIRSNNDELYKSTFYSDKSSQYELDSIKKSIDGSIKNIIDNNADNIGEPNISRLYERLLMDKQKDPTTINEFEKIFGDNDFINNLTNSYLDNRWVKAIDMETDEVLKYMPKLYEAVLTIKDNVLSADSFNKDYLNIESAIDGDDLKSQFSKNIEDLKKIYNLEKLVSEIYEDISKYGECFYYCVPYSKAIQRLLDRKQASRNILVRSDYHENTIIIESSISGTEKIKNENIKISEDDNINYNIEYRNGYIESIIELEKKVRDQVQAVKEQSLTEQYFTEQNAINEGIVTINPSGAGYAYNNIFDADIEMGKKLPTHHNFDSTLSDHLELPEDEEDNRSSDGFIKNDNTIKEMNGCIVKKLKRERVSPIIINDICLGYYYFEFDENTDIFEDRGISNGMVNTISGLRSNGRAEAYDVLQRREDLLKSISANIADKIDSKFINNNQDLKKEIYHILKYNDQYNNSIVSSNNLRITYIPPEDIQHFYFKLDEDTKRGVSDLALSLIPAKLWVAIYITNCLGIMTRGNDKRVYYVKQSVEQNISKTLLKTIDEIKKSNFGIRQVENINSVLNITGRFNDYIIPRGPDGQSPIEFEVMQGQQIEIKTELLNLLEESAINVTGVPIEIINSRQSPDYAMQLTMSNSKFLRFIYSRQSDFQNILSPFLTKLYNIEFKSNEKINITLPPPLFINVTNTNQLIVNTSDYCNNIAEIIMVNQSDELKNEFSKQLKIYHLGSYINMDIINNLINKSKQELTKTIVSNPESIEGEE